MLTTDPEFERMKEEMREYIRTLLPGIALDEANVVATLKDGTQMTVELGPITYEKPAGNTKRVTFTYGLDPDTTDS
jgi:hypothetical protein